MQALDRQDVERAFEEMGELLRRAKIAAEIAIYGGTAILLQFDVAFRTGDVDARVRSGDHGAVLDAARRVADRRGWLRSWFSEAVTTYLSSTDDVTLHRAYPDTGGAGLRVYVARPDYLLAMKLAAMRAGSRDESDAALLSRASGITTFDAMIDLMTRYFPKDAPDPRRMAIIGQFAKTLDANPP